MFFIYYLISFTDSWSELAIVGANGKNNNFYFKISLQLIEIKYVLMRGKIIEILNKCIWKQVKRLHILFEI